VATTRTFAWPCSGGIEHRTRSEPQDSQKGLLLWGGGRAVYPVQDRAELWHCGVVRRLAEMLDAGGKKF
jgi:hypothetical protein